MIGKMDKLSAGVIIPMNDLNVEDLEEIKESQRAIDQKVVKDADVKESSPTSICSSASVNLVFNSSDSVDIQSAFNQVGIKRDS